MNILQRQRERHGNIEHTRQREEQRDDSNEYTRERDMTTLNMLERETASSILARAT